MNEIKIITCIVVGVLLANFITYVSYSHFVANNGGSNNILEASNKTQKSEVYHELKAPKINITIKNDSYNQLICENIKENKVNNFLTLDGKKERSYENIDEGEYIGCSIAIDSRSSTTLNWFHAVTSGVYTLSIEQVECKTCTGTDRAWATIVVTPNGKREYQSI